MENENKTLKGETFISRGILRDVDANDIIKPGLYGINVHNSVSNYEGYGFLLVFAVNDSSVLQIRIPNSGWAVFVRTYWYTNGWSDWKKIVLT